MMIFARFVEIFVSLVNVGQRPRSNIINRNEDNIKIEPRA